VNDCCGGFGSLSQAQFDGLGDVERAPRWVVARRKMVQLSAHYMIDCIKGLPRVLTCIQEQL